MKVVHEISPEQYAALRESVLQDEMNGIDPGAYWAKLYPGATEVEFKVVWNADESTGRESKMKKLISKCYGRKVDPDHPYCLSCGWMCEVERGN